MNRTRICPFLNPIRTAGAPAARGGGRGERRNRSGSNPPPLWGIVLLLLLVITTGCRPNWQAEIVGLGVDRHPVNYKALERLADFATETEEGHGVPLERVLYRAGHRVIERLVILAASDGASETRHTFDWVEVAGDAWWLHDGRLVIDGAPLPVARIEIEPPELLGVVEADIVDIAPTVAAALGLRAPKQATGQALALPQPQYEHILLLFLDGFGYVGYTEALDAGLIPYLATLDAPHVGLTVYPPCTAVASASLLTGAPPSVHGVNQRNVRSTEMETLFDVAAAAGLQVVAVEGNALSFNLRHAEITLSGDRDGDGSTDDNVLANALSVLEAGMPDLFYVHFHGIDDAGHTYGPGAPEEQATIGQVDAAMAQIVEALPADTLIVIFADHGMHPVDEGERQGNHGHLIARDMLIPIFVVAK